MNISEEIYKKIQEMEPNTRDVILYVLEDVEAKSKLITLGREDEFVELKGIVQRLAVAQERTEKRVEAHTQKQHPEIRRYRTFEIEMIATT